MEASNMQAMREALKIVLDALKKAYATLEVDRVWLADNIDIITAALSAPASQLRHDELAQCLGCLAFKTTNRKTPKCKRGIRFDGAVS